MKDYRDRKDLERITIQDKYSILGFISSGTYGKVYKANDRSNLKQMVAIKKFKPDREGEVSYTGISQSACREIMLNREIQHENLTALQEVMLQDKSIYLVFEYCEHDFLQIIHHHSQSRSNIPEGTLKSLLWQLLNGLNYLHANWIVHRDLKPANILVTERGVVKIGDLGLARSYHSPIQSLYASDKVVVTIWYRAPELLLGARHYTPAIDVWSVGCIMGELLYLRPIFKGDEAKPDPHHHHHQSSRKNPQNNGVPFQKDQLTKIFDILGTPTKEEWPSIVHLPEYPHMSRFEKTTSTLRQWYMNKTSSYRETTAAATTTGGAGTLSNGQEGYQLMSGLLRYEPSRRLSASEALQHLYFTSTAPLPSRDCFFTSSTTTTTVVAPPKYPLRRVSPDDSDPKMSSDNNLLIRPRGAPFPDHSSIHRNNVSSSTTTTTNNNALSSVALGAGGAIQGSSRPSSSKRARYD